MLGWPCTAYPIILYPNDKPGFTITWDQSAMVAGFLMLGNVIGTPFSTTKMIPTKYGLILGRF